MRIPIPLSLLGGAFLLGCAPDAPPPPDVDQVRAEIAQRRAECIEAAFAEDPARRVAIWAPDVRMLSDPGGVENLTSARQHTEVAEAAWPVLSVTDLTITPDEVRLLGDPLALEIDT